MSDPVPDSGEMNDMPADAGGDMTPLAGVSPEASSFAAVSSVPAVALASTVGRKLRAAREAADMTVVDVAQSLKFSPRQIELLEADDYAALPGTTVVRGFVRSYAKLFKLDADNLLAMLDEISPSAPTEVRPPDNMGSAADPAGMRQMPLMLSLLIVLVLAAVLVGLWHFFGASAAKSFTLHNRGTTPAQTAEPVQPSTPAPDAGSTVSPAAATPAVGEVKTETVAAEGAAQPANVLPALIFSFSDRAWVEVTDAAKQSLYRGEGLPGSPLKLTGRPPFDLVVGNAAKVTLTYGDRTVNLAPHVRANVARLTLE